MASARTRYSDFIIALLQLLRDQCFNCTDIISEQYIDINRIVPGHLKILRTTSGRRARRAFRPSASHCPEQHWRADMSATLITAVRPAAAKRPGAVSRLFVACWDTLAGYLVRRSAIATLR